MKKILGVLFLIMINITTVRFVTACTSRDAEFTLEITGLKVNVGVLEKLCSSESCTMDERFITIKSHYNEEAGVLIGRTPNGNGFSSITIRLPYTLNTNGVPEASTIKPTEYNWIGSVNTDLTFLKSIGVLDIADADIQTITGLALHSGRIMFCDNKWQLETSNCGCSNEKIVCTECAGMGLIEGSLPKVLLQK